MAATGRVRAYPVTGDTGRVFPDSAAALNEFAEWGYMGFSLANLSATTSFRVTFVEPTTGSVVDIVDLSPGESRSDWYGPQGITFRQALDIAVTASATTPYPTASPPTPDSPTGVVVGSVRVG